MSTVRVVARLDVKGPNVVKGIHLEGLRALGKPKEFAEFYYRSGADELLYMDVVASLYGRNSLTHLVEEASRDIFIPITVGGGIRSLSDIRELLRSGADKVAINTAAITHPQLIREAAETFGSSTIVVAIETIREPDGRYLAYTDNGREYTGRDASAWAEEAVHLGAGELLITSVDREGTGEGYDVELLKSIAERVCVPVVAHGGAGKPDHVCQVVHQAGVDAVAIASLLHYSTVTQLTREFACEGEGNYEFVSSGRMSTKIQACSIGDVKAALADNGIPCRPIVSHHEKCA